MSDPATIAAFAGVATTIAAGLLAAGRAIVVRHLAALTHLEELAQATAITQERTATILDTHREHFADLHRDSERTSRQLARLLDHAGLSERDTEPTTEPPEIPRAETARRPTGRHRAVSVDLPNPPLDTGRPATLPSDPGR